MIDLNGDGQLSEDEIVCFIQGTMPDVDAERQMRVYMTLGDTNQDGFLDLTEFIAYFNLVNDMTKSGCFQKQSRCWRVIDEWHSKKDPVLLKAAFGLIDADRDGVISLAELTASDFIPQTRNREAWAKYFIAFAGKLHSDGLSLKEFQNLLIDIYQ